jgi:hypothetical protein
MTHRLGTVGVMCLFAGGAVGLGFIDYDVDSALMGHLVRGAVSFFVALGLVNWFSQLAGLRLPSRWFRHQAMESRRLYRHLGVVAFRTVLLRTPFRFVNQDIHMTGASRTALVELETRMRTVETNHATAFGLTILVGGYYGILNDPRFVQWFLGINVLANAYPVMLQRFNRLRISHVIERATERVTPSATVRTCIPEKERRVTRSGMLNSTAVLPSAPV